jgi:hypothetical protein
METTVNEKENVDTTEDIAAEITFNAAMDAAMKSPEYKAMLNREYDRRISLVKQALGDGDTTSWIFDSEFLWEAASKAASDAVKNTNEFNDLLYRTEDAIRRKPDASQAEQKRQKQRTHPQPGRRRIAPTSFRIQVDRIHISFGDHHREEDPRSVFRFVPAPVDI